jgi:uncharacterized protein YecE (DUF72 family)
MLTDLKIPESYARHLRIGSCSWKYDSWKGLVYEPDKRYRPDDYLPDYAKHFTTVEIDQWFWSLFPSRVTLPDPDTAKRYAESVPADFRFTIKAPNAITLTHSYSKQPKGQERHANEPNPYFLSVDLLHRFLEALDPMQGKLGPVVFQFEYLNREKMPSLPVFLDRLQGFFAKAPAGYQYAVEKAEQGSGEDPRPRIVWGPFPGPKARCRQDPIYVPPLLARASRASNVGAIHDSLHRWSVFRPSS